MLAEWKSEVCDVDGDAGYAAGTWVMTWGGILGGRDHHIMNGVKEADDGSVERSTATERGTCLVSTICSCALLHTWGGSLKDIGCVGVKSSKGGGGPAWLNMYTRYLNRQGAQERRKRQKLALLWMVIGSEKDAVQMGGTAGNQLIAVDFIVVIRKKNNFEEFFRFASGVLKMKDIPRLPPHPRSVAQAGHLVID